MKVVKISQISGIEHEMEIPITQKQLNAYYASDQSIQDFFPFLTADQREFILTGITPEEWNKLAMDFEESMLDFE